MLLEIRISKNLANLGGGGGGRAIKCQGQKREENWSKLCDWGGQASTLALILEGEM